MIGLDVLELIKIINHLSGGLAHLQAIGIDPDYVTPVGLLVAVDDEEWLDAEIGAERFLRVFIVTSIEPPTTRRLGFFIMARVVLPKRFK